MFSNLHIWVIKYREQRERERIAQYCPGDTLLKANSAFHLALQQQNAEYSEDTLEVQRRYRGDVPDFGVGIEDKETVFDINSYHTGHTKEYNLEVNGFCYILSSVSQIGKGLFMRAKNY